MQDPLQFFLFNLQFFIARLKKLVKSVKSVADNTLFIERSCKLPESQKIKLMTQQYGQPAGMQQCIKDFS